MIEQRDADLVAAARAGDKDAFGQLVERYQQMVKRIALGMVRSEYLAQELMQETILQAYLSLDQLRNDDRFKSWLYGIALNVCRSYIRRQRVRPLSLEEMMGGLRVDELLIGEVAPPPEAVVEERDLRRLVMEAIDGLSPKNRSATLLFYYEQLSIREISSLLGVSIPAVKGRLHKSRKHLRAELLRLYPEISRAVPTQEGRIEMVKVTVADVARAADVFQEEEGFGLNYAIVVLLDKVGRRLLPIWVGIHEGELIALSVLEHLTPRPLTFAFMGKLLEGAGVALESVRVEALKEDTFYAIARVRNGDVVQEIDARPSDAIPLALQMKRPIYVSEAVMEEAGIDISDQDGLPIGTGIKLMEKRMTEAWEGSKEKVEKVLAQTSREEIKRQIGQGLVGFLLGSEG